MGVPATSIVAGCIVSRDLLVLKFGGDALATPKLIAQAALAVALEAVRRDIVVVTSARRGVTDHLLELWNGIAAEGERQSAPIPPSAERALATGEVVTASLLAAALSRLSVRAVPLDAREAGILGSGPPGAARIRRIRTRAIAAILARNEVPVVAGFQVAERGRIRILGRGGSDVTAAALGVALDASCCRYLKLYGLRSADPRCDPNATFVRAMAHRELRGMLAKGASVLHPEAQRLAERYRLRLEFEEFPRLPHSRLMRTVVR